MVYKKCIRFIPTGLNRSTCRYPDVLVGVGRGAVNHEVKVGRGRTSTMLTQVARDRQLIAQRDFGGAVWHFYVSGVSGKAGPSPKVLDALAEAGIPYYVHWA